LLYDAVRRSGARAALMIGDRLDTDIEGGRAAGVATLLVLTGISDAAEVLAAPPASRPDHIGVDLDALRRSPDRLTPGPRPGWTVSSIGPGVLGLAETTADADPMDALLALCGMHWDGGRTGPVRVIADGPGAERALRSLGLDGSAPAGSGSATVVGVDTAPGAC
ncbi:MAG: HAD hydrolase-like protein, partial [Pseudonocardia sp.]